jgi:hypothetical protein
LMVARRLKGVNVISSSGGDWTDIENVRAIAEAVDCRTSVRVAESISTLEQGLWVVHRGEWSNNLWLIDPSHGEAISCLSFSLWISS